MNKHTPGPWNHHKAPRIDGGTIHCIQAGKSHGVSVCSFSAGKESDRIDEVCEANARLIAAAPELLAALELVKDAATAMRGDDFNLGYEQWKIIHAAIARAKGEA